MLVLAALLVTMGAGTIAFGLARTKRMVAGTATGIDVALGRAETPPMGDALGLVYRAAEPLLMVGGRLMGRVSPKGRIELIRLRLMYA
ncbi:MAG: hypothetical protein ACRDZW_04505, partial [Acidimicrobiales bacterium]